MYDDITLLTKENGYIMALKRFSKIEALYVVV